MQDSSNFNAPPSWIWSGLWSDAKIWTISICYNRQLEVPTEYYNAVQENPSKRASKDMYSRFTAVKKKRRHCKMSYVLLQLHCFLASLSFQFILKCTTDCIFIELKLTWVCDWLIHPCTTLLCDPIYCSLLALSCVIQSTAAFLCLIQATAAFLHFLVQSTPICQRLLVCPNSNIHDKDICCNYVLMRTKIQHSWRGHVATMFPYAKIQHPQEGHVVTIVSMCQNSASMRRTCLRLCFDVCQNSASMTKTFSDYVPI